MISLGIIGAGIMGERMARAVLDHAGEHVRLACVWDPSAAALARWAEALPGVAHAASAEALIGAVDCVYVASPPASHLAHGAAALEAGKALFLEKPLSVNPQAARDFVAGAAGARAAVNFPFAGSPAVEAVAAWLPEIGEPRTLTVDVAFREWPRPWQKGAASWLDRRAEGGFTREVVSHFLFLTRRLVGPMRLVEHLVQYPQDGRAEFDIRARLKAGAVSVKLTGNVGNTPKDDHNAWTLRGDRGAVRLRDWSVAEIQGEDGTWHAAPDALPNERQRPLVLKRQLASVAAMTRGEGHHLATLAEALAVQEVVEGILRETD